MRCNNCGHLPSEHEMGSLFELCLVEDCACIALSIPNWSCGEVR